MTRRIYFTDGNMKMCHTLLEILSLPGYPNLAKPYHDETLFNWSGVYTV